jgi:radical SAM protein with 4Fe4S-binding SPASM domain
MINIKNVCVLPFMHALVLPNGNIALCCNSEVREKMPNVADEGLDNLLNNTQHISVRKEMLAGKQPDICRRCWDNEKFGITSYRQQQTLTYLKYLPRVITAPATGEMASGIKYLDIRFNNTCNLKCVMCSSNYSSLWQEDEKELINIIKDESFGKELKYRVDNYDKNLYKWSCSDEIITTIINNSI